MTLKLLAQHNWNTYTYTDYYPVEYAWYSEYTADVDLPAGYKLVVGLAGAVTEVDARVPSQYPIIDSWSLDGLAGLYQSGLAVDGACHNSIFYSRQTADFGSMAIRYKQTPKVHGAGTRLVMVGVDASSLNSFVFDWADNSAMTGTSGSISIPGCLPAWSLLSICTVRGSQAITPGAGQQVLYNQLADDNSCRVMVTHSNGLTTLTGAFSWAASAAWTVLGVVFKSNAPVGTQIAVIG
jgi:hypothetical protein